MPFFKHNKKAPEKTPSEILVFLSKFAFFREKDTHKDATPSKKAPFYSETENAKTPCKHWGFRSALPSDVAWVGDLDANPFSCFQIEADFSPQKRLIYVIFVPKFGFDGRGVSLFPPVQILSREDPFIEICYQRSNNFAENIFSKTLAKFPVQSYNTILVKRNLDGFLIHGFYINEKDSFSNLL